MEGSKRRAKSRIGIVVRMLRSKKKEKEKLAHSNLVVSIFNPKPGF